MTANPFPGLRPFTAEESHLFFGRQEQIDELASRLGRRRFIAVMGASGSGKSSLVQAGLVPALHGGYLTKAGANWRMAVFRPGVNPIGNLARALSSPAVLGAVDRDPVIQRDAIEITLRRSGLGLVEAVHQARLSEYDSVLIVADQFEELFRFRTTSPEPIEASNEAAASVKLLLEAVAQTEMPIYVVLTMRSDFLGDCSVFRDLPEAINDGLYLIPRMQRPHLRAAIDGPVAVAGGSIAPRLVERLINDAGDDPDQLPVLQHAVMRAWSRMAGAADSPALDLQHYEAIGGMASALSNHADEAYAEFAPPQQAIAEALFKALTEKGPDNREVRRPLSLAELSAVAGVDRDAVAEVVERFRMKDRSFLTLSADGVVDISHESLIRQWKRLTQWATEEAESRELYTRIADAADRHQKGQAALLRDPELQIALDWWERTKPIEAWARRYHSGFQIAQSFLHQSVEARAIENARLYRETLETGRIQNELKIAAQIQRALLPEGNHSGRFFQASGTSMQARGFGGDFFDLVDQPDGTFGFLVGDVSGKGPPAALVASKILGIFSAFSQVDNDPAETVDHINRVMMRRAIDARYVTLLYGRLAQTGEFLFCNGGHNPPLIFGKEGLRLIEAAGMPVGLVEAAPYSLDRVHLQPGDTMVIYSDGVTEALNVAGEEFGVARMAEVLKVHSTEPVSVVLEKLIDALKTFTTGAGQTDDITALIVRYSGP